VVEGLLGEAAPELYRPVAETASFRNALVGAAKERLHEAAAVGHTFCEVSERVETGKPWRTILAMAQEMYADLIVVGAHVHGGFGRLLLGSTADQVVRHAFCPVLVVRETAHSARARFRSTAYSAA
jgi:nucleotide-binding universal stress UspA family protein